jgi:hypothetical protein
MKTRSLFILGPGKKPSLNLHKKLFHLLLQLPQLTSNRVLLNVIQLNSKKFMRLQFLAIYTSYKLYFNPQFHLRQEIPRRLRLLMMPQHEQDSPLCTVLLVAAMLK